MAPVPSGDASSTMTIRRSGTARSCPMSAATFARSLYVGMMTNGRMGRLFPGPLESQRGDLLGHEPDEKHDDGEENQDHGAVGDLARDNHVPDAVRGPGGECERAQRQEDAQRAEQRHDLQQYQKEARAVPRETDLRAAGTWPARNRLEGHVGAGRG